MKKRTRTLYLDVARTIAIIAISLNHAVNRTYENYSGTAEEFRMISRSSTMLKTCVTIFSRLGVPLFLMITGGLLLNKKLEEPEQIRRFYRHNLGRLFLTSEIWYFIMFWFIVLWKPDVDYMQQLGGMGGAVLACGKNMLFLDQITLGSMWYIPMILCVYAVLPGISLAVQRLPRNALWLPLGVVFLSGMLIPTVNNIRTVMEVGPALQFGLSAANICSVYLLYLLIGYWIIRGTLQDLKDWMILLGGIGSFVGSCVLTWWTYASPPEVVYSYEFPGYLFCAAFLLEILRRKAYRLERLRGVFTYLAEISLGIYFVHILIMEALDWYVDFSGWHRSPKLLFLEGVSVGGSILIIWLLSHVKVLKRNLFLIKDNPPECGPDRSVSRPNCVWGKKDC